MQDHPTNFPALPPVGVTRFLPSIIVIGAVAGFSTLAWYAYQAGTQSLRDEDLLVVEAEKTPLKERPLDPGGMKFPNQDKTIFDAFSGGPQAGAKVERLLPEPEEPNFEPVVNDSGTTTWVNKKMHPEEASRTMAAEEVLATPPPAQMPTLEQPKMKSESAITSYTRTRPEAGASSKNAATLTPPPDRQARPVALGEPLPPAASKPPASASAHAVQLGAYRGDEEARKAFAILQKKHAELADRSPVIVRADLGAKGIFYRLRIGGFSGAEAAGAFCRGLTAKGQACLPVK
jgi:hypothetical protein